MMYKPWIYLIFAGFIGVASIILIPKEKYKKFFIYGILFGALADTVIVAIFSKWLNIFNYKNMGPFNILGLYSVWTPMAWTFMFAIYLYLLPVRKVFLVPYVLTFFGLNVAAGMVLTAFGLFEYTAPYNKYIDMVIFITWLTVAAWAYIKAENIKLINSKVRENTISSGKRRRFLSVPAKRPAKLEKHIKIKKPIKITQLKRW